MPSRQTLQAFLATARKALATPAAQRTAPLTFVVGNESADLDSLSSAVVYAYIRTNSPPHTLHIPLSNLPRVDLGLRTEMAAVLSAAGLGPADLLTLSELPDLDPDDTRWMLVDHNCLTGSLNKFAGRIVGCIDHHADEGVIAQSVKPRVVEPCGSCMSLVVDETRHAWDALSKEVEDGDAVAEDEKLAKIGLASILSDTINLTAKEKVRDKDPKAVAFLRAKIRDPSFDRTRYFDDISAVKEDISGLNFRDIFRKDYKEWDEAGLKLGISCSVQGFDYLVDKAGGAVPLLDDLADWTRERGLDVASLMTTSHPDGQFQRHLLVWGLTDEGKAAVERFRKIRDKLELETWGNGALDDGAVRGAWRQHNLGASRKQVAPLLREALKKS
ncbi:Exopolyphosphatase [Neonectria punicea]|uniref:Exopolyphosphatase n=1 Tax=Neonectria punicea TaxID=979145 RepID=A0ABR1HCS0_9HYPO